jgi:transcriptional regulator with XRE-family HTH domain
MREVGKRLKELRKHLNLTQTELGKQLGIKGSAVGKQERGEALPSTRGLQILASRYNASIDYLLCNRGTLFYDKDDLNRPGSKRVMDGEVEELFSLMARVPLVRNSVMAYFQRFMIENRDVIEKELAGEAGEI